MARTERRECGTHMILVAQARASRRQNNVILFGRTCEAHLYLVSIVGPDAEVFGLTACKGGKTG